MNRKPRLFTTSSISPSFVRPRPFAGGTKYQSLDGHRSQENCCENGRRGCVLDLLSQRGDLDVVLIERTSRGHLESRTTIGNLGEQASEVDLVRTASTTRQHLLFEDRKVSRRVGAGAGGMLFSSPLLWAVASSNTEEANSTSKQGCKRILKTQISFFKVSYTVFKLKNGENERT